MRLEDFPTDEAAAYRKVRRHSSKPGFRRVGRTEYSALSTMDRPPDIEDLCDTTVL
jgi:hypothetical protein